MNEIEKKHIIEIKEFEEYKKKIKDKFIENIDSFLSSSNEDYSKLFKFIKSFKLIEFINPYKKLKECNVLNGELYFQITEIKTFLINISHFLNIENIESPNYQVFQRHYQNSERILLTIQNLQVKVTEKSSQISLQLSIRNSKIATFFFLLSLIATLLTSYLSCGKTNYISDEELIRKNRNIDLLIDSQKSLNSKIKELDTIICNQKVSIDTMALKIDSLKKANKKK
jgi:hypothetical protein